MTPSRNRPATRASRRSRLHVVITSGPTREFFDAVRFISNPSTGRMGYAIAAAAARRGHRVTLISGPVELRAPANVEVVRVTTAAEMAEATRRAFQNADAAVFTAAVCDYRPKQRADRKVAKSAKPKSVVLEPTEDIAASLGSIKGDRITIGFAMEDHNGRAHAERKLQRKRCDAIVLNGPRNVGSRDAEVSFLRAGGKWEAWPPGTKAQIALRLIRCVENLAVEKK